MNKNLVIIAVVVVALAVLGGVWYLNSKNSSTPVTVEEQVEGTVQPSQSTDSAQQGEVKEFTIYGSSFKYEPSQIKVNKGDKVKITFQDEGGTHDLTIDEFGIRSKRITTGEKETLEFIADKSGSFSYYCSVPGHRASGMVGTLLVE